MKTPTSVRRLIDVGDGLSMTMSRRGGGLGTLQVDCGSQSGGLRAAEAWARDCPTQDRSRTGALLVTHYHTDHYNGWLHVADSGGLGSLPKLDRFYHPRLPTPESADVLLALFALRSLGSGTGSMDLDLWRVAARLSGRNWVRRTSLVQGDTFPTPHGSAHVLWPPAALDERTRRKAAAAVERFHEVAGEHPRLAEIYEATREATGHLVDGDGVWEFDSLTRGEWPDLGTEGPAGRLRSALNGELKEVNDVLRGAANSLGLAFFIDHRLLFLGDLEGGALSQTIRHLVQNGPLNFDTVVAPHHGTKWSNELYKVRARCVEMSVGSRLQRHVRQEWRRVALCVLSTRERGTLVQRSW